MTYILAKFAALTKKDENGLLPCPICGDSGFIHRKIFGKDGRGARRCTAPLVGLIRAPDAQHAEAAVFMFDANWVRTELAKATGAHVAAVCKPVRLDAGEW